MLRNPFDYVMQPNVLGNQVPERAIFQVMTSGQDVKVTGIFSRQPGLRLGDGINISREEEFKYVVPSNGMANSPGT